MFGLPFAKKPKTKIVAVGDETSGIIYLHKFNGRTGIERRELDAVDEIETKLQLLLLKLAKKISEAKEIEIEEALQLIFTEDTSSVELMPYTEELEKLMTLRKQSEEYKDLVVNVMIRERIAYPVEVAETARKGEKSLKIEPLSYDIPVKSAIKFDATTIYLGSQASTGDDTLIPDEDLMRSLEGGSIGFLVDDNGDYKIGNPNWSVEMTNMIPDSIADQIFQFYQGELLGSKSDSGKNGRSKNRSKSSNQTSQESVSTGKNSTGESEVTEPQMSES